MKMKVYWGAFLLFGSVLFSACQSDETPVVKFSVNEFLAGDSLRMFPGQQLKLTYSAENMADLKAVGLPEGWKADIDLPTGSILLTAPVEKAENKTYDFMLQATGSGDATATVAFQVRLNTYDDPEGVFILNEGNMTTENGSLTYIAPDGSQIADAYKTANGTELGNVCQDMFIVDGRAYIISQNGDMAPTGTQFENDGMLIVADARTMQKKNSFTRTELAQLEWPTNIAVLDSTHIYIRDKKGIWRLDASTRQLSFVKDSDGAPQAPFVVSDGKVYTFSATSYIGYIWEIAPEQDAISKILLPMVSEYSINNVLGLRSAGSGQFWVLAHGFGNYSIGKYNVASNEIVQKKIEEKPNSGASGYTFTVHGDHVYYAAGTSVYQVSFTDDSEEQYLLDVSTFGSNARMLYNGIAVHPVSGHLYVNTIKEFQNYTANNIWEIDPVRQDTVAHYDNLTRFPAGFYFPEVK